MRVNKIKNDNGKTIYVHDFQKAASDASGSVKNYKGVSRWTVISWQGGTDNAYKIIEYTFGNELYNGVESSNFTTNIDKNNSVIRPFLCKRVQGGLIAKIHISNPSPGNPSDLDEYLDYGNGDCDDIATLSINGGTSQIVSLPLQFWPLNL